MANKNYLFGAIVLFLAITLGSLIFWGLRHMRDGWTDTKIEDTSVVVATTSKGESGDTQPVNYKEMLVYYDRKLKKNPDDFGAVVGIADAYFGLQRYKDAIRYYQKAIEINSDDVASYNDLGLSYHYLGQSDKGLKYVEEGLKINPLHQRLWLTKGFILATTGRITDAINAWQKAYGLGPDTEVGKAAKSFLEQYKPLSSLK